MNTINLNNKQNSQQLRPSIKNLAARFLSDRWITFGGGYYGIMALATYMHIQVIDWWQTFSSFSSFSALIDALSVSFFIGLFIEAIKNMIIAFIWFSYWPDYIDMALPWVWLATSYFGYIAGQALAKHYTGRQFDLKSQ